MAEAFTCWGCIIWRHKLIRPWKSQVSDTIRRRLIKPISHLNGLALPPSLAIPFRLRSFHYLYLVRSLSLFRLYCTSFFFIVSQIFLSFFPLRFPRQIKRLIDWKFVNKIIWLRWKIKDVAFEKFATRNGDKYFCFNKNSRMNNFCCIIFLIFLADIHDENS